MFTGIIEGLGRIAMVRSSGKGKRLAIDADFILDGTRIGDSIAVSGACLTVVEINRSRFEIDVSPETLEKTTLGNAETGERVNIERALRLSDRLDGHLVSGHADGLGTIERKKIDGNAVLISVGVPPDLSRYIIKKGSVAVDGVSLTVNNCDEGWFEVSIIPHTGKLTTIGFKEKGAFVNIETDLIGKYIERFVRSSLIGENEKGSKPSIDMEFLARTGFI
jgi:riboflavin synthase